MAKFYFLFSKSWHFVKALLFEIFVFPLWLLWFYGWQKGKLKEKTPWVISGHRGRAYLDNAASLHQYITSHTEQKIVWITKNAIDKKRLEKAGHKVMWKNSLAARWTLCNAPVHIYTHGEDDLDSHLLYWNKLPALRIYLNHSLNLVKTGQLAQKSVEQMDARTLEKFKKSITKFDYLLAVSERERKFFLQSFPVKEKQVCLGGGAHLDKFFAMQKPHDPRDILYFPTFRDLPLGKKQLSANIQDLVQNKKLLNWLRETKHSFSICFHINSSQVHLPEEVQDVIKIESPENILELMEKAKCFISDYSGLIADYLILDKPFVAFPFDMEEYTQFRRFYASYEELIYGPEVRSVRALVDLLISGNAFVMEKYYAHREWLHKEYFSHFTGGYSQRSYETIQRLLTEHSFHGKSEKPFNMDEQG
jgi:CDP-glycerol glycerophosphotransferase (TagB/SpsB family)